MKDNNTGRLYPLNDFLFKKIFGEDDKELLIGLLNAILDTNIKDLTVEKDKLEQENEEEKLGILDIKAKTNTGQKINIEVQLLDQKNMVQRTLFYWSKLFTEDFKAGGDYVTIQKTITINILDFELEELRDLAFHSRFRLGEKSTKKELTDLMEMHFIEIPKFREMEYDKNKPLHRWLLFLQKEVPEETLKEVLSMDKTLQEAERKLERLSADPATRREYERRAKALSDEKSRLRSAKEEGIITVAKNLLDSGMPLSEVAEHTPYEEEQLKKLLSDYNE